MNECNDDDVFYLLSSCLSLVYAMDSPPPRPLYPLTSCSCSIYKCCDDDVPLFTSNAIKLISSKPN